MKKDFNFWLQPEWLVYRVSSPYLYWYNDPKAVLVRTGLNYFEAVRMCDELAIQPGEPVNKQGYPLRLYKYCSRNEWNSQVEFSKFY